MRPYILGVHPQQFPHRSVQLKGVAHIQVKVIEGVFSNEQKSQIVRKLTDAKVEIEGETMHQVTWCIVDDVKSGE